MCHCFHRRRAVHNRFTWPDDFLTVGLYGCYFSPRCQLFVPVRLYGYISLFSTPFPSVGFPMTFTSAIF